MRSPIIDIALSLCLSFVSVVHASNPFPCSPGFDIESVAALAKALPSHSWEFGTATEALFEIYNPELSVFGHAPFPVRTVDPSTVEALSYAASVITIGTGANALSNGDGAVGDPASLGVGALMLGKTNSTFQAAADAELAYVVDSAPRAPNGAISQRVDVVELWADFMYMAPPYMAFYAADSNNLTLLQDAVDQAEAYRETLFDPSTSTWHHIIGPQSEDLGHWSTGNGWAAAGMTRVLAVVMKAPVAYKDTTWRKAAIANLTTWIQEIVDGAMASPPDDGLLRNYLDDTSGDGHGYGEISGTSLLANVAYRMAVLQPKTFTSKYVEWAEAVRKTLAGNDANGNPHVTSNGTVTPAVNPLNWYDTTPFTSGSPEGQNFVVLMYAAWRDCVFVGTCSK